MVFTPDHRLLSILGLVSWGDIGEITIYRNHNGKLVAFPKTYPHKPASPTQTIYRNKMKAAANNWNNLFQEHKDSWNRCCRKLSIPLCGYALYVSMAMHFRPAHRETLRRQSGETLYRTNWGT